jgi:hypothetical protein
LQLLEKDQVAEPTIIIASIRNRQGAHGRIYAGGSKFAGPFEPQ